MIDLKTYSDGSYNEPDYYLPETTDIDLNKNILKYIENNNRVLIWDSSSGGAGDFIVNGGQPGDIIIKSTDGGDISIGNDTYNGLINIGSNSSTDNIHLNGGLEYQFDKISTSNNGPGSFLLGVNHYIIEVTNTLVNNIQLPSCLNTSGRVYIIILGYTSNNQLNIFPDGADTISNDASEYLSVYGQTIKLLSDGYSNWLVV